jgi:hypothetical protein
MKRTAAEASTFPEAVWRAWWEREEAKRDGHPRIISGGFDGKTFFFHAAWYPRPFERRIDALLAQLLKPQPAARVVGDPLVLPGQEKLPGI